MVYGTGLTLSNRGTPNPIKAVIDQYQALNRTDATSRDLARLYAVSVTVGAVAELRADNVAQVPMKAVDKDGNALTPTHPLSMAVANVADLMKRTELAMFFWGHNLLVKERNAFLVPRSLRWVNPTIYDTDVHYETGLRGFHLYGGTYKIERTGYVTRNDAVYMHGVDFENDFDGVSPAERAFLDASVEPERAQTALALFRNLGVPAMVAQPAANETALRPTPDDAKGLIAQIRARFQGAINSGRTLVQTARWEILTLQSPLKDMALREIGEETRLNICIAARVPMELIMPSAANFAQFEGARRTWGNGWLIPRVHWYAAQLTEQLASDYGDYRIVPDLDAVEFLQEDAGEKVEVVNKQVAGTLITLTAAQKAVGLEPDPALEGLYMVGGVPVPKAVISTLWRAQYPTAAPLVGDGTNAADQPDIFEYHISSGIVRTDEVRQRLGFPPLHDASEARLRDLNGKLATLNSAVQSGIPLPVAAQMVGLELPEGVILPDRPLTANDFMGSGNLPDPAQSIEPQAQPDVPSLWVGLSFKTNADLLALQQNVKRLYPNATEWTAADDFHLTLAYAPAADEAVVTAAKAALEGVELSDMVLRLASLRAFDSVGQYALHFRIRQNADLLELQDDVYTALKEAGVAMSSYSAPDNWLPHITMGYLSERPRMVAFSGRVSIQPSRLTLMSDDTVLLEIALDDDATDVATPEKTAATTTVSAPEDVTIVDESAVEDELLMFGRKAAKACYGAGAAGAAKTADTFTFHVAPDYLTTWLRDELRDLTDAKAVKAAVNDALLVWDIKAYYGSGGTRDGFYDAILGIIKSGQADETSRRQFAASMRAVLRRYGLMAFRDGMNEVGYDPESFSQEQLADFRAWQNEQSGYVTNLGAEVFKQGIAEGEVEVRARMWADISLDSIRVRGVIAGGDPMMKRVLGEVKTEHCPECLALAGQVHPASEWAKRNLLIGTSRTTCKQGCHCTLTVTNEPESGNWI